MRFYFPFLFIALLANTSAAQGDRCQSDELQAALMEDSTYARSYFAFEAALAEMSSSAMRSSSTHVLPVVVHIMHAGASLGTGSNVSDAQVNSAIDALNADFRGEFGGADIDIEFALAVRDPDGNPTTGILRSDVSEVIPSFSNTGMVTTSNLDPSAEMNVKNLSHWPGTEYINVWVLHKLNGGTSPLGFAYLPPTSGTHDGIVLHHKVFGVGEEYDLLNNFDLNRTLSHEMGHYLSLLHTFSNTNGCSDENNCSSQGDRVCDTPPTTGSIGCSPISCPATMVENFMDYSNDDCMDSFTEGQRTRMRDALVLHRNSLLNSDGTVPVMATDMGLSSIQGIASTGCASSIAPEVLIQNLGSNALNSATLHFSLDGGTVNEQAWNGNLASGASEYVSLPTLAASSGSHDLNVWLSAPDDGYALNDTLSVSFEVLSGSFVNMEIQLDVLPFGFGWSLENSDDGTVVMSGTNYDNGTFAGDFIEESQCATNGCYELTVTDLFGNGLHYPPGGWYALTDDEGTVLGSGSGNFGSSQSHAFCIDGEGVPPCEDLNANDICDSDEDLIVPDVPGCTDASSCNYNAAANLDDGSCLFTDALGDCGGDCPGDVDGDNVCDNAEIPGCIDPEACNYNGAATDDAGNCTYPPVNFDCEGNVTVAVFGCLDVTSCTFDATANTDDGSCEYLDALGDCGGACPSDNDGDGVCDNAEIPGCTDASACNYDDGATEENGNCTYASAGFDCDGNVTVAVYGCTDAASCTFDAGANTDDGSCEYPDALGECGGECPGDADGDGVCDNAEIPGCTDASACNYDDGATEENGNCNYPPANFDCEGNLIVVVYGCTDAASCTFDAGANTDDGSCEYLDALGECGGECPGDADGDGVCDNAEIPGCTDGNACNYDEDATDESGNCEYATEGYDCDGNLLNVVEGCTDEASCTYDVTANTDDGSCEYLDALGECGGDCEADTDGDGICDTAEILGCTDPLGCNYDSEATEENGGCEYAEEGFDCDGNPLTNSIAEWAEQAPALTPFPNPSSKGQSTQVLGLSSQGPWTVSIWSSDGKLMGQQLLLAEPHLRGWRIELSAPRQTGLYFIRVTSADHTSVTPRTGRLIVR